MASPYQITWNATTLVSGITTHWHHYEGRQTYSASRVEWVTHIYLLTNEVCNDQERLLKKGFQRNIYCWYVISAIYVRENTKRCFRMNSFRRGRVSRNWPNCIWLSERVKIANHVQRPTTSSRDGLFINSHHGTFWAQIAQNFFTDSSAKKQTHLRDR